MALICLCHGVSERKVNRVIDHGAVSVDEVGESCGAGTSCGTCRQAIDEMIVTRVAVNRGPGFAIA